MRLPIACLVLVGCGATPPRIDGGGFNLDATSPSFVDGGPELDAAAVNDSGVPGDMKVTTVVRVHYPAGPHSIALRGSIGPLNWIKGIAMTGGAEDVWSWSSDGIDSPLEWKPLLDDATWSRGPNYKVTPGATADVYPHFNSTRGNVVSLIEPFHSTNLPDDRTIRAYLPPSYDENPRATFPVVYMHDGQNLFDPLLAFGGNPWKVDQTLDAAAEDGSIREAIVIGIDNTSARIHELTPTDGGMGGGGGDAYLAMITEELKPLVDKMLRTRPGRMDTAILGSSLGGLISAYAGVKRPDVFGLVGAMSPSTWWDNLVIVTDVAATKGAATRPARIYLDSGDSGQDMDDVVNTDKLAQTYISLGYIEGLDFHHIIQAGGQHNEIYWAERLPGALAFLLGPRTP